MTTDQDTNAHGGRYLDTFGGAGMGCYICGKPLTTGDVDGYHQSCRYPITNDVDQSGSGNTLWATLDQRAQLKAELAAVQADREVLNESLGIVQVECARLREQLAATAKWWEAEATAHNGAQAESRQLRERVAELEALLEEEKEQRGLDQTFRAVYELTRLRGLIEEALNEIRDPPGDHIRLDFIEDKLREALEAK